jgi:hypothetical protein
MRILLADDLHVFDFCTRFADKMPNGIDYDLRKLHYGVALQANRPALGAVFAYVPTSQVLLSSDYPPGTSTGGIRGLDELSEPRVEAFGVAVIDGVQIARL